MDLIYCACHRDIGEISGLPRVRTFRVFHFTEGTCIATKIVHKTRSS
jgi:hypothetical protein